MVQSARPSTDADLGNYQDELGGTTSIFQSIDEAVSDDNDWVESESGPSTSAYVTKLSAVTDPLSSASHVLRYRYGKAAAGPQVDFVIQLRQGYVNEAAQGTLIASDTHTDISEVVTQSNLVLTGVQADAITDYGDLYVRITMNQV